MNILIFYNKRNKIVQSHVLGRIVTYIFYIYIIFIRLVRRKIKYFCIR